MQANITNKIEWCKSTALAWEGRQRAARFIVLVSVLCGVTLGVAQQYVFAVVWVMLSSLHVFFYFWLRDRTRFYRYHQELWTRLLHDPDHANDYAEQMTRSLDEAQARAKHWWG